MAHRGGRRGETRAERSASRATHRSGSERGRRLNQARRQQYRRLPAPAGRWRGASPRCCSRCLLGALGRRRSPGCCSSPRSGPGSTLATGWRCPSQPRRGLLGGRGPAYAPAAGDGGLAAAPFVGLAGIGDVTRWRPRRLVLRLQLRRRRGPTTIVMSAGCASSRHGLCAGAEGGVGGPVRCSRSLVRRFEHDVLVVSIDRLTLALRAGPVLFYDSRPTESPGATPILGPPSCSERCPSLATSGDAGGRDVGPTLPVAGLWLWAARLLLDLVASGSLTNSAASARGCRSIREEGESARGSKGRRGCGLPTRLSQAGLAIQWVWSLSRLCVAVTNRHSECAADLPLRMNRSMWRLCLICPNTGSIVIFRCA